MITKNIRPSASVWDYGLWKSPYLQYYFEHPIKVHHMLAGDGSCFIGWGQKKSGQRAMRQAQTLGHKFLLLEDGFIRSLGLGVRGARPLSLVMDDLGIYYNATQTSRLEQLILEGSVASETLSALALVRDHGLSKYNQDSQIVLPPKTTLRVLVIDQTVNDASVRLGGGDETVFNQMLYQALLENPDAEVLVKIHPDVLAGKKRGYLTKIVQDSRVKIFGSDISPHSLLSQVDKVYVVTSQMGFEALLLHKQVICFGLPWYAGWGLTDDRHVNISALKIRRNANRSLEQLFSAAYLRYAVYLNPFNNKKGQIFDVIKYIVLNKKIQRENQGLLCCLGMSLWKQAIVKPFLQGAANKVHFFANEARVPAGMQIVSWGTKYSGAGHWRMEDGFLRSVGLGSDLFAPISLVLDKRGMYYDPHSGSDLEKMLLTQNLNQAQLSRAEAFRQKYVASKVSKYNLGQSTCIFSKIDKKVILVPGQVEDDASILRGSPIIKTNQELLERVRKANPEEYIVFKPHPDVVAGNRTGSLTDPSFADLIVTEANIIDCIQQADEVHTMTSLAGFEALLHGKIVHCYGGPFYAGWGLTVDHFNLPHRRKKLSLDEVVYGVYLEYPRYLIPGVAGFVRAEDALQYLVQLSTKEESIIRGRWLSRKSRKLRALIRVFF